MQPQWAPAVPGQTQATPFQPGTVSPIAAVKFLFSDPDWKTTLLIGTVFMLIPFVGPIALAGWMCEVHQRLVRRHPRPLAKLDFTDLTHYLGRGLVPFVVQLVVTLPMVLVVMTMWLTAGFAIGFFTARGGIEPAILVAGGVVLFAVVLTVNLLMAVLLNAGQTRAELTEDFGAALSFGAILGYSGATWTTVMIKVFVYGFVAVGVVLAGMLLLCVGMYPAAFVVQVGQLHLRWQIYEKYRANGGAEIPLKAPVSLPSEVQPQYGIT